MSFKLQMFNKDNTEALYNEKLLAKLSSNREIATSVNSGVLMSPKQRNMLLEARRTQRKLVGESVEYQPQATHPEEPASATNEAAKDDDPYAYLKDLASKDYDEELDMQALFDDAAAKIRDNIDNNNEAIKEEVN